MEQLMDETKVQKGLNNSSEGNSTKPKGSGGGTSLAALLSAKTNDSLTIPPVAISSPPISVPFQASTNDNSQIIEMYKGKNDQLLLQIRELQLQLEQHDRNRVDNISSYQQSNSTMKKDYEGLMNRISQLQERIHELETASSLELMQYTEKCNEFERECKSYHDQVRVSFV